MSEDIGAAGELVASEESAYEKAVNAFDWRFRQLMEELVDVLDHDSTLANLGATTSPIERWDNDESEYRIAVKLGDASVDVSFHVYDAALSEGEDFNDKLAFGIEIATNQGEEVSRLAPLNYTPEFWLDAADESAIKNRLRMIEELFSPYHAADLIAKVLNAATSAEGAIL